MFCPYWANSVYFKVGQVKVTLQQVAGKSLVDRGIPFVSISRAVRFVKKWRSIRIDCFFNRLEKMTRAMTVAAIAIPIPRAVFSNRAIGSLTSPMKTCGENAGARDRKKGDKIGFCNADRLQADENGIAALCTYLVKQGCGKKRWNSSHNLERPYSRTNDGKYNRRQIEKWAKEHPPREFWEKKYPGWTLTDDDYGVQYEYNDFTGWAVYLKLRKKE